MSRHVQRKIPALFFGFTGCGDSSTRGAEFRSHRLVVVVKLLRDTLRMWDRAGELCERDEIGFVGALSFGAKRGAVDLLTREFKLAKARGLAAATGDMQGQGWARWTEY